MYHIWHYFLEKCFSCCSCFGHQSLDISGYQILNYITKWESRVFVGIGVWNFEVQHDPLELQADIAGESDWRPQCNLRSFTQSQSSLPCTTSFRSSSFFVFIALLLKPYIFFSFLTFGCLENREKALFILLFSLIILFS